MIVRCFCLGSLDSGANFVVRAREALKTCLPDPLRNASFAAVLKDDNSTKRCLAQLLYNLSDQMGPPGVDNPM